MFCKLADPQGENNALSQVLYGLALRYVSIGIGIASSRTPSSYVFPNLAPPESCLHSSDMKTKLTHVLSSADTAGALPQTPPWPSLTSATPQPTRQASNPPASPRS